MSIMIQANVYYIYSSDSQYQYKYLRKLNYSEILIYTNMNGDITTHKKLINYKAIHFVITI